MPKIDRNGRLISPRAARELSLLDTSLLEYNHMSFGGPRVKTATREEEDELVRHDENKSNIGRFAKKLLAAVADKWDRNVVIIDKISPPDWKSAPAGRILEFSILHLAMSKVLPFGSSEIAPREKVSVRTFDTDRTAYGPKLLALKNVNLCQYPLQLNMIIA
ncbi:unnamed protein product [Cochlearia groenlandica]